MSSRLWIVIFVFLAASAGLVATASGPAAMKADEASLRAADEAQLAAARTRNADALDAMMHRSFIVTSPEGQIWPRQKVIDMWRNGGIGHDRFERTVEAVVLDGDVGVVAGREIVQPDVASVAGQRRADGGKPVGRRFTNVYLWKDGRWQFLARHANEMGTLPIS